ncbi:hypothetical protein MVEN_00458500 [Mycena venus]|uniref:Uncharacterized protein n=1 Tax=Mycena venus TaxID=2733690 RepID=A0A8H6YT53_9AGAR|nr:hypothetical protein MVEN_00458500 [Mycena venus]
MPSTPRSPCFVAILWTVAFCLDIVCMGLYIALIIRHRHNVRWYHIVALTFISIGAVGAAYNAWRWWRIHRIQTQVAAAAILTYSGANGRGQTN